MDFLQTWCVAFGNTLVWDHANEQISIISDRVVALANV